MITATRGSFWRRLPRFGARLGPGSPGLYQWVLPFARGQYPTISQDYPVGVATEAEQTRALIPPDVAFELLFEVGWESRHQYIDVRTAEEFAARSIQGAINIPHMLKSGRADASPGNLKIAAGGLRMVPNPGFVEGVKTGFPALNSQLIIGSANKNRRATAAVELLEKAGYTHVLAMDGGLKAWMAADLPVEEAQNSTD